MRSKECCRSCTHCVPADSGTNLWCRLRKIKVHPEIEQIVFCHHWTRSSPSLPVLERDTQNLEKQLDFGQSFAVKDL